MNLHEYQGKELLRKSGVPVAEGMMVETVEDAVAAAEELAKRTDRKSVV